MTCQNIKFSKSNYVPDSEVISVPEPTSKIDYIATEFPSELVRYNNPVANEPIIIDGSFPSDRGIDYIALIDHNFGEYAGVDVKFELFESGGDVDLLGLGVAHIGTGIPWGVYEFGVDPFASGNYPPLSSTHAAFLDEVVHGADWRLTLTPTTDQSKTGTVIDIPVQHANGQIVLTAENPAVYVENANGQDNWESTSDAYTGITARKKVGGFHASAQEGPRLVFPFKTVEEGVYNVYALVKAGSEGADSLYTIHDNEPRVSILSGITTADFSWQLLREISLSSGKTYDFQVCGREADLIIDRIVIRSAGLDTTGLGGSNESETVTTYESDEHLSFRMLMMGRSTTLERNFKYGYAMSRVTPPKLLQTESGHHVQVNNQQKIKRLDLSFPIATEIDRFNLAMLEERNLGSPVFVNPEPSHTGWEGTDKMFLGRFAHELTFGKQSADLHNTTITVLEA